MSSINKLSIACWNSRGYLSSIPHLRYLLNKNQFVATCEHWLHNNRLNVLDDVSLTHFYFARSSGYSSSETYGSCRGQGGVAIFWKKDLAGVSVISSIIHDRICGVKIHLSTGYVISILSVYLPAVDSEDSFHGCLDDLSTIVDSLSYESRVIVVGDFNADMGRSGGPRRSKTLSKRGLLLYDFLKRHRMCASNMMDYTTGPVFTYVGPMSTSTLDYILFPEELVNNIITCRVEDEHILNTADHYPVNAVCKLEGLTVNKVCDYVSERIRWDRLTTGDLNDKYLDVITPELDQFNLELESLSDSSCDIDASFEQLINLIHSASAKLPRSRYVKHIKPFLNPYLSELNRLKVNAYRLWVNDNRPRNKLDDSYIAYKDTKKNFAKAFKATRKAYENEQILEVVRSAEVNKNKFWKLLQNTRSGVSCKTSAVKGPNRKVAYEIDDILTIWKSHFESLEIPKYSPNFDNDHFIRVTSFVEEYSKSDSADDTFLNNPFKRDEVSKALQVLNSGKASGLDGVTTEHLRYAGDSMVTSLTNLCNSVRVSEYIPACCRVGVQIPLYKGKDTCPLDPNNYRGITLLSVFNKILEILVWHRIESWWETNRVISDLQGACKKGLSCIHTAMLLQETVATSLETNRKCLVAYFDVAKSLRYCVD